MCIRADEVRVYPECGGINKIVYGPGDKTPERAQLAFAFQVQHIVNCQRSAIVFDMLQGALQRYGLHLRRDFNLAHGLRKDRGEAARDKKQKADNCCQRKWTNVHCAASVPELIP